MRGFELYIDYTRLMHIVVFHVPLRPLGGVVGWWVKTLTKGVCRTEEVHAARVFYQQLLLTEGPPVYDTYGSVGC